MEPVADLLTSKAYLAGRVAQYRGWYDGKAVSCKAKYLRMRAFTVIGGGLVPVLANIPVRVGSYDISTVLVTVISLFVVVFVSLESVFHYREQWKNYRSTEQLLGHEEFLFHAKVGPYKGLQEPDAFLLLVERVEDAIAAENSATLNVMTLAAEAAADSRRNTDGKTQAGV
jgi:hypothetical protein